MEVPPSEEGAHRGVWLFPPQWATLRMERGAKEKNHQLYKPYTNGKTGWGVRPPAQRPPGAAFPRAFAPLPLVTGEHPERSQCAFSQRAA